MLCLLHAGDNPGLGLDHYEEGRIDKIEEKRLMRHNYTRQNLTTGTKNVCNICRVMSF